jgi:hypothetical protein
MKMEDLLKTEGKWFAFAVNDNEEVFLKIRPLTPEVVMAINKTNIIMKTKKKWKIKAIDWSTLTNEVSNYVLEDFKGFGGEDMKPIENTLENRRRILDLAFKYKGGTISDFVMKKACELGGIKWTPTK